MAKHSYEEVRFLSLPAPEKHPSRIGAIARIMGLDAKPIETASVLEIGCGAGDNILPIAAVYPNAKFVGIDSSEKLITEAKKTAQSLGLENISFKTFIVGESDEELGSFDYVLCFGMYSWVASQVQDSLIKLISKTINETGLACISYNSFPGWNMRSSIRSIARTFDKDSRDAEERVHKTRALLTAIKELQIDDYSPYGQQLREQLEFLESQSEGFIYHEILGEHVSAVSIKDLADKLSDNFLHLNADARMSRMRFLSLNSEEARKSTKEIVTKKTTIAELEQLADIVSPISLRTSILSKNRTKNLDLNVVDKLYLASPLVALSANPAVLGEGAEEFIDAREYTQQETNSLMKGCIIFLSEIWPESVPLKDLIILTKNRWKLETSEEDLQYARERFLSLACMGLADFSLSRPLCLRHAGEFPISHPYARLQAGGTKRVTNYRHEYSMLDDFQRIMISYLDGTRDIPAIQSAMVKAMLDGKLRITESGEAVKNPLEAETMVRDHTVEALRALAEGALLTSESD
ncbi:MAG: methyltransferase domain-containing protein [Bdellovibrionota bacterium]